MDLLFFLSCTRVLKSLVLWLEFSWNSHHLVAAARTESGEDEDEDGEDSDNDENENEEDDGEEGADSDEGGDDD